MSTANHLGTFLDGTRQARTMGSAPSSVISAGSKRGRDMVDDEDDTDGDYATTPDAPSGVTRVRKPRKSLASLWRRRRAGLGGHGGDPAQTVSGDDSRMDLLAVPLVFEEFEGRQRLVADDEQIREEEDAPVVYEDEAERRVFVAQHMMEREMMRLTVDHTTDPGVLLLSTSQEDDDPLALPAPDHESIMHFNNNDSWSRNTDAHERFHPSVDETISDLTLAAADVRDTSRLMEALRDFDLNRESRPSVLADVPWGHTSAERQGASGHNAVSSLEFCLGSNLSRRRDSGSEVSIVHDISER